MEEHQIRITIMNSLLINEKTQAVNRGQLYPIHAQSLKRNEVVIVQGENTESDGWEESDLDVYGDRYEGKAFL